jgi:hypothetical protein
MHAKTKQTRWAPSLSPSSYGAHFASALACEHHIARLLCISPTQPHHTTMLTRLGSFMGLSIAAFRLWPNKDSLFYLRCPWKKKMKFYLGLSASTAAPLTVVGRCFHHEAAAGALLPPPRSRRLLRRCHPIRHLSCNHSPLCLADLFLGLWMHALHFTGVTNWPMVEVDSGLNWICD